MKAKGNREQNFILTHTSIFALSAKYSQDFIFNIATFNFIQFTATFFVESRHFVVNVS